ncbi:hypothetical protein IFU01_04480 [Oxalobacteraceae sp. CFBP 8763]|nr:hypothetical protein [Oxalobacteraceae sp. CFBP 8763]
MNNSKVSYSGMGRRHFLGSVAILSAASFCEAKPMKVTLNVVLFNYLNRPIFDVFIDGKVGRGSDAYPATGAGIITGVPFDLGPKTVTWRLDGPKGTPRNGETITNKNPLRLDTVKQGARYLGVHIYPDDTVELTTSISIPDWSARGAAMAQEHGHG